MKKTVLRVAAIGALATAGWGFGSGLSPAKADQCNNETADHNYYVNNTRVGYDDGSTGLTGVYVVCAQHPLLAGSVEVGGGVHQYRDAQGQHYDVYYCLDAPCAYVPFTINP